MSTKKTQIAMALIRSTQMPAKVKARYSKVAVVIVDVAEMVRAGRTEPTTTTTRSREVVEVLWTADRLHHGGPGSAALKKLREAEADAAEWNKGKGRGAMVKRATALLDALIASEKASRACAATRKWIQAELRYSEPSEESIVARNAAKATLDALLADVEG